LAAGSYQFAIVRKSDDKLLGNCSLHNIHTISRNSEIGLFIGEDENRRRGYGTQVMELLLSYGFFYLNLNNIMLKVFSFNEHAIHVYKKVGFKEFGRRRQNYYLNGQHYDDVFMDILKEEFPVNHIQNANV
jgi:Acetyltransferases, including N-acetylases of ribosomal proteins